MVNKWVLASLVGIGFSASLAMAAGTDKKAKEAKTTEIAQAVEKLQATAVPSLESVAPYPAASQDQIRHVIFLPPKEQEDNFQVELSMGKVIEVDCNRHFFGGAVEEKTLEGWGYSYLVLGEVTGPMSTRMACPGMKKTQEFVPVVYSGKMERYNSKLPIVVYTPKDVEVRYRLWTVQGEYQTANPQ